MKFLKFNSVLPGFKHEHVTDFRERDRLLSHEFWKVMIKYLLW